MDKDKINSFWAVINCFESGSQKTDYSTIYIYGDGPGRKRQITLGRGITEYGNLKSLIELYVKKNSVFSKDFAPYLSRIGKTALVDNGDFKKLLVRAAKKDAAFRACQDTIFEIKYLKPARAFFDANGFVEELSLLVILDSTVHSGSMLSFLMSRFPEKRPVNGGDEKQWISQYVKVRKAWLAGHSNKILRNTTYRMDFFEREISKGNWDFNLPVVAHGVKITSPLI